MSFSADVKGDDGVPTGSGYERAPADNEQVQAAVSHPDLNGHLSSGLANGTVEPQELTHRLIGMPVGITLHNTDGEPICLAVDASFVVYIYPGSDISDTHGSDTPLADAEQHRGFRDLHDDLIAHRFATIGVSSQSVEKQQEMIAVNRLPQQLACDESLRLADLLVLPTFLLHGKRRFKRVTLVIVHGVIVHVFYPITFPGRHAAEVAAWLRKSLV
jgi:peroxiredoxin